MSARDVLAPRAPYNRARQERIRAVLSAAEFCAQGGETELAKDLVKAAKDYILIACWPLDKFVKELQQAEDAITLALEREDPAGMNDDSQGEAR